MKCSIRSNAGRLLLVLSLLLCSATSWADAPAYDGPELPPGWYPIHETELTELETTLTQQDETIERQETTLNQLSGIIGRQQTTISELGKSFETFVTEAKRTIRIQQIEVRIWQGIAVAALLGLGASLIF